MQPIEKITEKDFHIMANILDEYNFYGKDTNFLKGFLKKVWNTDKHLVYTYFLHIAEDDDVYITYEELDYDRVDKTFNDKSDIAIANSTVTKKVKALDAEDKTFVKLDGSRPLTGDLNIGTYKITNVGNPADNYDAVNKNFVESVSNLKAEDTARDLIIEKTENLNMKTLLSADSFETFKKEI